MFNIFFKHATAALLNCYVSHGSTERFLTGGEKCHIYLADNSLLFPTVRKNQNRITVDEVIEKRLTLRFL